jgi:hypothetical protein
MAFKTSTRLDHAHAAAAALAKGEEGGALVASNNSASLRRVALLRQVTQRGVLVV